MEKEWEKEAEETIDKAYDLIEESDSLTSITENGLRKAISDALSATYAKGQRKGLEEAAKIADNYEHKDCLAESHDERYCSYCEAVEDGAGYVAQAIKESVKP